MNGISSHFEEGGQFLEERFVRGGVRDKWGSKV
jgi:hypothetical protein